MVVRKPYTTTGIRSMMPGAFPETRHIFWRFYGHLGDLLRLAWPVMLSRAGILVMAFVDIAMLGRYSTESVAVSNLGLSIYVPLLVSSIGFCSGVIPVVAHAYGAGQRWECGAAWRRALIWASFIALIGTVICWHAADILAFFGQKPEMAQAGGKVAQALSFGLWPQLIFVVCAFYLEATRRPIVTLWVMLVANILNPGLNWLLIYGHWGLPELGAVGAAIGSSIARLVTMILMLSFILAQPEGHETGIRGPWQSIWGPGGWQAGQMMRRLGLSAGLSSGFETISFTAMILLAGSLGVAGLSAYAIGHNLVATVFMVGLGLSVATGVRVGQARGAGDMEEAAFAGWTGVIGVIVIMGPISVLVLMFRHSIAQVYTDDPALQLRVSGLFLFTAMIFIPDSLQVIMGQAVRALGDAWVAVLCYVIAFLLVMIPAGWVVVYHLDGDERGLSLVVTGACAVAFVLLSWRFWVLTRSSR